MLTRPRQFPDEASVVLVEDEPLVRLVTTELLRDAGFRVIEAHDAREALALLEARPETRVMITDVRMPGAIDGIVLARVVARRWPGIGIVVTSGHATPRDGDLPEGAAFLRKPWVPSALIDQVQRLFAASREAAETR